MRFWTASIFRMLWQYRENWLMLDMWQKSKVSNEKLTRCRFTTAIFKEKCSLFKEAKKESAAKKRQSGEASG